MVVPQGESREGACFSRNIKLRWERKGKVWEGASEGKQDGMVWEKCAAWLT